MAEPVCAGNVMDSEAERRTESGPNAAPAGRTMAIITAVDSRDVPNRTLEVGYELARDLNEELVVLHVMPQEAFDEFRSATSDGDRLSVADGTRYGSRSGESNVVSGSGSAHSYTVEDGERNAANVVREVVDGTLGDEDTRNVSVQGRVGDPAKEVIDEAERRNARYLVIGGRKRTPVGKAVFGSITQSILLGANVPVMAVMDED